VVVDRPEKMKKMKGRMGLENGEEGGEEREMYNSFFFFSLSEFFTLYFFLFTFLYLFF
jgi:hypothetical protein